MLPRFRYYSCGSGGSGRDNRGTKNGGNGTRSCCRVPLIMIVLLGGMRVYLKGDLNRILQMYSVLRKNMELYRSSSIDRTFGSCSRTRGHVCCFAHGVATGHICSVAGTSKYTVFASIKGVKKNNLTANQHIPRAEPRRLCERW